MPGRVRVQGKAAVSPSAVKAILGQEAERSEKAATALTETAIREAAPVGPGRRGFHLRDKYRFATTRSPYGLRAQLTRAPEAWYGRVVERGRRPGESHGRRYPGARANPFVDRTMTRVGVQAERIIEEGGIRAGERIAAEAFL